jgi:hypothetical protein
VARPLREQFALATFLLLGPVAVVMSIAAGAAYRYQLAQVYVEAETLARVIAGYLDAAGPAGEANLETFLDSVPVPRGASADTRGDGSIKTGYFVDAGRRSWRTRAPNAHRRGR